MSAMFWKIMHCLEAMKIVHHHANGRFDWLISEHQSINLWKETISTLSGKNKRLTFVHPVCKSYIPYNAYTRLQLTNLFTAQ